MDDSLKGVTLLNLCLLLAVFGYSMLIVGAALFRKPHKEYPLWIGFGSTLIVLAIFTETTTSGTVNTGLLGGIAGIILLLVLGSAYAVVTAAAGNAAHVQLNWVVKTNALFLLSMVLLLQGAVFLTQPWTWDVDTWLSLALVLNDLSLALAILIMALHKSTKPWWPVLASLLGTTLVLGGGFLSLSLTIAPPGLMANVILRILQAFVQYFLGMILILVGYSRWTKTRNTLNTQQQ